MNTTATGLAGFENSSGEEDRENQQLYKLSLDRLTEWSGFEGKVRWCTANILGHPINLNPAIPNPLNKNVFEGPFKVTEKKGIPSNPLHTFRKVRINSEEESSTSATGPTI